MKKSIQYNNILKKLQKLLTLVIFVVAVNLNAQQTKNTNNNSKNNSNNNSKNAVVNIFDNENKNFYQTVKDLSNHYDTIENKKGTGYKPFKRMEYFWSQRMPANGVYPNLIENYNSGLEFLADSKSKNNAIQSGSTWSFIGVNRVPDLNPAVGNTGVGRFNYLEFHPTDPKIIWAASSSGGVWRTTNTGLNWVNFDQTDFMSIGIADIAISNSNPNIVYAATGDANGPSGMGAYFSVGIYKTTNNGQSWNLLPTPTGGTLTQANQFVIYAMEVHPTDPNKIYLACNGGMFYSQNGGNNWSQVSSGVCRDIVMHPTNPNLIYGALRVGGGSYKISMYNTTSNTWNDIQTISNCTRIRFAVHPNFPNTAYAIAVNQNNGFRAIFKTVNSGITWIQTSSNTPFNYLGLTILTNSTYGQGTYDLAIAMSPRNENELVIGGIHAWISSNSGTTFTPITNGYNEQTNVENVHPDQHYAIFKNNRLYLANDGGIVYSDNFGTNWNNITDGLSNTEHSRLSVASNNGNVILSGSQDNGTYLKIGTKWNIVTGGDGMDNAIDPTNSNIMYTASQNGRFFKSTNGGMNFGQMLNTNIAGNENAYWCAPFTIDPKNANVLYAGYQNIWKSTNKGSSWSRISNLGNNQNRTITWISVSPSNSSFVYACYSDFSSPNFSNRSTLVRTIDGGNTWNIVYTHPSQSITSIAVHPTIPTKVYFSLSGYGSGQKVFQLDGTSATNISGNLPNLPVNIITYQPNSPDRLIIGNDMGVFARDNNNTTWVPMGIGLPNVIVNDIEVHTGSGKLKIATYGRGIWELDLTNCSLSAPNLYVIGEKTICQGDSLILESQLQFQGYEWSNGAKTRRIVVKSSGNYFLTVTDDKGCKAISETINVTVGTITPLVLEYDVNKLTLCKGDSLVINAKGFYSKFEWSNGESNRRITIKESGDYTLKVTSNTSSCTQTSKVIKVTFLDAPEKPILENNGTKLIAPLANSYKWYRNNLLLTGITTKEYTPSVGGLFKVEVINAGGCSTQSDNIDFIIASVENDNLISNINIIPNPNNGNFKLQINENLLFEQLLIVDLNGNILFDYNLVNNQNKLNENFDISNYAKGTYYLILKNSNYTISKTIIKN